jgi:DNA-binding GntR family transcriptional regulator
MIDSSLEGLCLARVAPFVILDHGSKNRKCKHVESAKTHPVREMHGLMPDIIPSSPQKSRPATTVAWILQNLRTAILEGSLEAHALVRQDELAATYGVSRMPIREAIRLLEAEGLVVSRPNRGVVVAPLDPDDAQEIFDVRGVLEPLALRRSIPRLTDLQKQQAKAALDALEHSDPEDSAAAHRAFHLSLHAAAGARLVRLIGQYLDAAQRYLRLEATLSETVTKDLREHRALLAATIDGDVDLAVNLMQQHVGHTGREMTTLLRRREATRREMSGSAIIEVSGG